jgi:hypothetical protein
MRALPLVAAASLLALPARADPQRWPLAFDPAIAEDPAAIQQLLATGDAARGADGSPPHIEMGAEA